MAELIWVKNSTANPAHLIFTPIGMDCLCYLAGNSQTAPTFFSNFQDIFLKLIHLEPTIHNCPNILDPCYFATGGVYGSLKIGQDSSFPNQQMAQFLDRIF